ncbi:hypothetical protein Gpo141_00010963 [Globisporangium polare]
MASKSGKDKGDAVHSMITPLASTRDAPFLIQSEDEPRRRGNSTGTLAHKLRSTTVVGSDSAGRSTRSDSNQSTRSQYTKGEWNNSFGGCCLDCRNGSISSLLLLACCPCFSAAKTHGMLGSSFEFGVIYFGGLVFGMVISLGLSFSNTTGSASSSSTGTGSTAYRASGYVGDDAVAQEADPTTVDNGSATTTSGNNHVYGYLTLLLLALFLLGIAFLRTKARHRFNIPGYRALDCVLSTVCCWCVLSQTQAHIEKNNRYEFGLDSPPDTLPAYL